MSEAAPPRRGSGRSGIRLRRSFAPPDGDLLRPERRCCVWLRAVVPDSLLPWRRRSQAASSVPRRCLRLAVHFNDLVIYFSRSEIAVASDHLRWSCWTVNRPSVRPSADQKQSSASVSLFAGQQFTPDSSKTKFFASAENTTSDISYLTTIQKTISELLYFFFFFSFLAIVMLVPSDVITLRWLVCLFSSITLT